MPDLKTFYLVPLCPRSFIEHRFAYDLRLSIIPSTRRTWFRCAISFDVPPFLSSHELNTKLPEGKKRGLFSGWGPETSRLHRRPHSRLGVATKASQFAASLLALCSSVTWLLTL